MHFKMHLVAVLHVLHLRRRGGHGLIAYHVDPGFIVGNVINSFTIIVVQV